MPNGPTDAHDARPVNQDKRQTPLPFDHHVPRSSRVHGLMHDHPDVLFDLIDAVQHAPKRKILVAVNHLTRPMYDDIADYVQIAHRTIRHHVGTLCDVGILTRSSKPTIVTYTDPDVAVLAHDAVSLAYASDRL